MHGLDTLTTFASSSPGLFQALGLNWQLFVEQGLAFLILLFILGKFVYPALVKTIDDRRAQIEAGLQEAKRSQEALVDAEAKVAELLAEARKDADDVLARAHQEATATIADAETKAKERGEQIVQAAREQLEADVTKARQMLKSETVKLVASATEHIVGEKLDEAKDAQLIKRALESPAAEQGRER